MIDMIMGRIPAKGVSLRISFLVGFLDGRTFHKGELIPCISTISHLDYISRFHNDKTMKKSYHGVE